MRDLRKWSAAVAAAMACSALACGQQGKRPVEEVVARVRANLDASNAVLPDVFCSEHLRSAEVRQNQVKREVILDSVLRATRQANGADEFKEERSIEQANGRPAKKGRKFSLPLSFADGFGATFASYFAPEYGPCNQYRLTSDPSEKEVVLEITRGPGIEKMQACAKLASGTVARFWLVPDSFEIVRFEMNTPHEAVPHGFDSFSSTIDYAPIPLGPRMCRLPTRVHAELKKSSGSDALVYDASYSGCHRFGSTMTIVSGTTEAPPSPQQ